MMLQDSLISFVLQWVVSIAACLLFLLAGSMLLTFGQKERGAAFYRLFHGLNFCVSLYAVIRAQFVTIHSLVIGAYLVWLGLGWIKRRDQQPDRRTDLFVDRRTDLPADRKFERLFPDWKWIVFGCLFFTAVLHFLPEGEFKQYDVFFYTKIAESMNATGQENLHTYNDLFDPVFHGVEPYHYAEMWLSALLMRGTSAFLPDVQVFRFVGYTVLCVCVFLGLGEFHAACSGRRPGGQARLLCLAFFFFWPDILTYVPILRHYILYNFENNCLERVNFRPVYLYLLPFLLDLKKDKVDAESGVYFVSLAVISYLNFVVLIPATLLLTLIGLRWRSKRRQALQRGALALGVGLCFYAFYHFFANRTIGGFYEDSVGVVMRFLRRHPFFVGSTIATTLGYMGLIMVGYCGYFLLRKKEAVIRFLAENDWLVVAAGIIVIVSVVMARVLSYQNNSYQLAYLGYMLTSLFVFGVWAHFGGVLQSRRYPAIGLVVFLMGYIGFKVVEGRKGMIDVYKENGTVPYKGKQYSASYLAQVRAYVAGRKCMLGGYLADSAYYHDLFFSSRNPNVYALPITYRIADRVGANYEFGLSDPAVLFAGMDRGDTSGYHYLEGAIRRSGLYVYEQQRGWNRHQALSRFIKERRLQYLVLSGRNCERELAGLPVAERFEDQSTGEIFLVIGRKIE